MGGWRRGGDLLSPRLAAELARPYGVSTDRECDASDLLAGIRTLAYNGNADRWLTLQVSYPT